MEGMHVLCGCSLLVAMVMVLTDAGCVDDKLCCAGKNVTCKALGGRMNDVDYRRKSRVCFCDEYCLGIRDCCSDYHEACKPVDCQLSGWSHWSDCSKQCGHGERRRQRDVIRRPRNGGKECDVREEKESCHGRNCKKPRHLHSTHQAKETAKIIPAMYGSWRKSKLYDPFNDIRKNLFNHYSANSVIKRPAYCAYFEVSTTRGSCSVRNYQGWSQMLGRRQTVCVECQPLAMKRKLGVRCSGDGVFLKETRWNAITMPGCHGKWTLKTQHEDCTCDPNSEMSFILL